MASNKNEQLDVFIVMRRDASDGQNPILGIFREPYSAEELSRSLGDTCKILHEHVSPPIRK
jgi:hypothetical protein